MNKIKKMYFSSSTSNKYMKHIPLLSFYLLLGFCFQFPSVAMRYWMMENVQVSPAQMSAIFGVVAIPWCLKPIYGFISDSYPIYGLRRRPYMVIMSFATCFMWILLPFVPHDEFLITLVYWLRRLVEKTTKIKVLFSLGLG